VKSVSQECRAGTDSTAVGSPADSRVVGWASIVPRCLSCCRSPSREHRCPAQGSLPAHPLSQALTRAALLVFSQKTASERSSSRRLAWWEGLCWHHASSRRAAPNLCTNAFEIYISYAQNGIRSALLKL